jgi:hypothetical protein
MEDAAGQPSRLQVAMQYSRRLQPLRFLFLAFIFQQLYLSSNVSLPSMFCIIMACAAYTMYVDSKAKLSPAIQPLPSPAVCSHSLPPLPAAASRPDLGKPPRCNIADSSQHAPPSPPQHLDPNSMPQAAPTANSSDDVTFDGQQQQQQRLQQQQQQQRQCSSQGLSISAAPWEPSSLRNSSTSLYSAKAAAAPSSSAQPPTSTVFVGNMSSAVTEADLLQTFASFGEIIVARIQRGTKQKGLKMCVYRRFSVLFLAPIHPVQVHRLHRLLLRRLRRRRRQRAAGRLPLRPAHASRILSGATFAPRHRAAHLFPPRHASSHAA